MFIILTNFAKHFTTNAYKVIKKHIQLMRDRQFNFQSFQ